MIRVSYFSSNPLMDQNNTVNYGREVYAQFSSLGNSPNFDKYKQNYVELQETDFYLAMVSKDTVIGSTKV